MRRSLFRDAYRRAPRSMRYRSGQHAFTVIELLIVLAVSAVIAMVALPAVREMSSGLLVNLAAREIATTLQMARLDAVRLSTKVAVKFRTDPKLGVTFAIYSDGDGDGVLTADIKTGVDPPVRAPRPLSHMGGWIRFGFPPGVAPRDPSDPSKRMGRLEDPIRFNNSDLASFNGLGTATPGSVYITDSRHHLAVVRVNHRAGRVFVMTYDRDSEVWQ